MPKIAKRPFPTITEDEFVNKYSETMTQPAAARMMGFGRSTVCTMCKDGRLAATPNGRVLVRSIYAYLYAPDKTYRYRIAK